METAAPGRTVPDVEVERLRGRLAQLEAAEQAWERTRHVLAAENQHLALRVKALEAQLVARAIAREALTADPQALSLFEDLAEPESPAAPPGDATAVATAPAVRSTPASRRNPGRQPLDPALPREVIRLPDPPESKRR